MASGSFPSGVDFNDKSTLDIYFQIRSFENDLSVPELLLKNRARPERLKIHTIADSFSLEYEYSTRTRAVRISREESPEAQIFVPEATLDAFEEQIPNWDPPHESYSQEFIGLSGFEPFLSSIGAGEDFLEERAVIDSQGILEDLALPPSNLDQITKILPRPENFISVHSTPGNLAQEVDELLSTTQSARKEQHRALSHEDGNPHSTPLSWEPPERAVKPPPLSTPPYTITNPLTPSPQEKLRRIAMPQYKPANFGRSESTHSDASDMTGISARSGRTGPLSDSARAGMKAVTEARACWRCKFLRKKCNPESPCQACLICPKGGKSNWEALGCHRGDFKERMLPLRLCPAECQDNSYDFAPLENKSFQPDFKQRELWVNNDADITETTESQSSQDIRRLFLEAIEEKTKLFHEPPDLVVLRSLRFCTICIVWELLQEPESLAILGYGGTFDNLLQILPAAVVYQVILESEDRLIEQSLICLRSCLEVLRFKSILDAEKHGSCIKSQCIYSCVRELDMNIKLYLDELSRVFFKKENLRNRGPSWLSIFYSFCIQSLVRTALLQITKRIGVTVTRQAEGAANQYLCLPLRLFIASNSGSTYKDPMLSDEATESGLPSPEAYQQAREAVNYANWHSTGIHNSRDYLKQLFHDEGGVLGFNPAKPQADVVTDKEDAEVSKRQKLNLWKCRCCREARKKCYPVDRIWPQKCVRCLAHQPEPLCCSEPQLNTRKRGPNLKAVDWGILQPQSLKPRQVVRRTETGSVGSSLSYEITSWSEDSEV